MKTYVIKTKLVPPIRDRGLVSRKRLLSMLAENAERSLVLVMAPAGYGKTTILGQWFRTLHSCADFSAWYSLDFADNELGRFFTYLVAAVRSRLPEFGKTILEQLAAGVGLSPTSLAGALINELSAIKRRVHVVLDDFHLISNPAVLDAMCQIVVNAPSNLHLVIASRESPPLPLGRLRALGRFAEINTEHLRFRGPETGAFMSSAGHITLSPEQIHTLERRTEGWAVGLQLASISLAAGETASDFITEFSGNHRDVAEFLTDDVLRKQDREIREFLLCTSILDRFCPALCDAILGGNSGRFVLDSLEARSLFIFSLDSEREWYRYHHLFADFLRRRLQIERPQQVTELHRRASQWFGEQGYFDEAIMHALAGRDMARAAELLNANCDSLFYSGRLSALAEWYGQIPQMHLRKFPRILLDQAWSLILKWQFDSARQILDDVQRLLDERTAADIRDTNDKRLHVILKHREMMYALFTDDMRSVDALCREMLEDFPVPDPYLRGSLYTCLIFAQREMFSFTSLRSYDARAQKLYEESGSRFVFIWHNSILGPSELACGNLDKAEASLSLARRIATEISGERSSLAAMPALLLAEVFYERNQVDATQWLLDQYLPLADQIGFVDQLIAGFVLRARLLAAAGESEAAEETLSSAELLALRQGFERLSVHIAAERVRKALQEGDLDTIRRVTQLQYAQTKVNDLTPCARVMSQHAIMAITWCRIACIHGRLNDAITLCRKWASFAHERGAHRIEVIFGALLAYAYHQKGERRAAIRALRAALGVARSSGFVRSLIDQPEVTLDLLTVIAEGENGDQDPVASYARELLRIKAPDRTSPGPCSIPEAGAPSASMEPLSDREREILLLVASGLRNQEIGDTLGLTEGTVKWHLQHIFDKAGTRRRMQAVERVRRLGLLG